MYDHHTEHWHDHTDRRHGETAGTDPGPRRLRHGDPFSRGRNPMTDSDDPTPSGRRGPRGGRGRPGDRRHFDERVRHGYGGSFFGRGARAARGDVRAAILALTAEEPMHGYQIIRELSERSGGVWSPSPGSVYPTLQLLEDEGLISGTEQDGKRVFAITDAGREALSARGKDRPAAWLEVGRGVDAGAIGLRDLMGPLMGAARQVAESGTPDQIDQAKALLSEARRGLYRILAEEPDEQPQP